MKWIMKSGLNIKRGHSIKWNLNNSLCPLCYRRVLRDPTLRKDTQ